MRPAVVASRFAPHGVPVLRGLTRAGITALFGPPPIDPERSPGDPGLYGPSSATWEVIGDFAAIPGGLRALLVQLLHPHAMAGVADHSAFEEDPLRRLQRTSAYVTTTAFGSLDEAVSVARMVRGAHRTVTGIAPDGQRYRASDPHLLTWVSIALTSSFLAAYHAFGPRPVDRRLADRFVAEQAVAAAMLDPRVDLDALAADPAGRAALVAGRPELPMISDGTLPMSLSELEAALAAFRPELGLTAQGEAAYRFLLRPPLPLPLRAAYLPLLAGALSTLPDDLRALLGREGNRLADEALRRGSQGLIDTLRLTAGPSMSRQVAEERLTAVQDAA